MGIGELVRPFLRPRQFVITPQVSSPPVVAHSCFVWVLLPVTQVAAQPALRATKPKQNGLRSAIGAEEF